MKDRVRNAKSICSEYGILIPKYHNEKSIFFNLPRFGVKECESKHPNISAIPQNLTKLYCDYALSTQQAKYNFPYYPYGLSLNAYWKTGTQERASKLKHTALQTRPIAMQQLNETFL